MTTPGKVGYELRISPTTVDKLGVKLYDKASAVVSELVANGYDADAEEVRVCLPLGTELARNGDDGIVEHGYEIKVIDDGHGMVPDEAREYFLDVGQNRRARPKDGPLSREKRRQVMGRKGIGKLAPFGICRVIEVRSAGGKKTDQGYLTSHFILEYDAIMRQTKGNVPLKRGSDDMTWSATRGTTITLREFWPRRVPSADVFRRQLAQRFALARTDFSVAVEDTRDPSENKPFTVPVFEVPVMEGTKIDVSTQPVPMPDGHARPVTGWLALAKEAYSNEEMAGVRIYARGKIVAITRDFEQPAGYTGEYTIRSYLVGEIHAEWLDLDQGEDLVRTDRQGILWDSEYGSALREWGSQRLREIGAASREPRRKRARDEFMRISELERVARERFSDATVIQTALDLGKQVGSFAAEDELKDEEYVKGLREVVLSVAPHRALMNAFQLFSAKAGLEQDLETLADLFGQARVAEMASYGQIAFERVKAISELEEALAQAEAVDELVLQRIIASAPYLIQPSWTVITQNQALKTFKTRFEQYYMATYNEPVELAITFERKRPDFVLAEVGGVLHIVEIKKPGHDFDDDDLERLYRYVEAFNAFEEENKELLKEFKDWQIDLVADGVKIKNALSRRAYESLVDDKTVVRISWTDFLIRAKKAHEQFLDARAQVAQVPATETA